MRKEAEEARQTALEAERAATDLAAAKQAEEARRVADKAEREAAKADKAKAHASGGSRAIGLRTYYTAELVDPVAALKHYKQAQPEDLKAWLQIGRAHVCTQVTNAHIVRHLLHEEQQHTHTNIQSTIN